MQLHIVLAFALLIWWPREQPFTPLISSSWATLSVVVGQMVAIPVLGWWASSRVLRTMRTAPDGPHRAQLGHHRSVSVLRFCVLGTFLVDVAATRWPSLVHGFEPFAVVPALSEFIIISPFLSASVLALWSSFPADRAIRRWVVDTKVWQTGATQPAWGLRSYMSFNIRHQLLAVMVPMAIIVIVYDVTCAHEAEIAATIPIPWIPDIILGFSAAGVFVIAPWLLKRIWMTDPLPDGPLRRELDAMCDRIGLRCRDILIWRSGGMLVNAAVMGLFPRLRYVLLSDGLLDSMSDSQVGAVFGHEAGHVNHKHIPFFLLFALSSMLISAGAMELLFRWSNGPSSPKWLTLAVIQLAGFGVIVVSWAFGFGFVSRRFERQADLFGARCVSPRHADDCRLPCGVHRTMEEPRLRRNRLCATGARAFAEALDRVALLNGIPLEEPSWRHSSIASRIECLTALAGDPNRLERFERVIRWIKRVLIVVCVVGLAVSAYYTWPYVTAEWTRGLKVEG